MPTQTKETHQIAERAEQHYLEACQKIHDAEAGGYQDKQALIGAHKLLQSAQRKVPQETRYLIELARLMFLIGDDLQCQRYLIQVLELEPEHKQALELQQTLKDKENLSPMDIWAEKLQDFESLRFPKTPEEFDAFYEEVETFIQEQVRYLLQQEIASDLTLNEETAELQSMLFQQIVDTQKPIEESLEVLYQEFEINELQQMLHPLRQLESRLLKSLYHNGVLQILEDGCSDIRQKALNLLKALKEQPEELTDTDQRLNQLLDDCDSLADDLDDLSANAPLTLIEQEYEELIKLVQLVQVTLDEH